MIKRAHIRQFLAVVDSGSFTQAARRLRVTQPALSSGIADLERLIGSPLFIRSRQQVRLTEAGGHFLPIARNVEASFRPVDDFGQHSGKDWPDIRFGTIRSVAGSLLQRMIATLAAEFSIEIIEGSDSELRAALASGRVHVALTLLRPEEQEPAALTLMVEPYTMLVSDHHRLAGRERVHPDELASEIMIARRSCELLDTTSRFFSKRGVRPRFAFRSDSDDRCLRMVAANLAITTAPLSLAIAGTVPLAVEGYDYTRRLGLLLSPGWPADAPEVVRFIQLAGELRAQ